MLDSLDIHIAMMDYPVNVPMAITDGKSWEVGYLSEVGEFIKLSPISEDSYIYGYVILETKDITYTDFFVKDKKYNN